MAPNDSLGSKGETLAAEHLESIGYRILHRNWRSPFTRHEIDIIALDGDCVVFVEVKTTRTRSFGDPVEWITPKKREAIILAARAFVAEWQKADCEFRFDAVTVGPPEEGGLWPITHVRGAFSESG